MNETSSYGCAPVARLASIRAVLAVAAVNDYEIQQIDIKGAYLNGVLKPEEVIYMKQAPGYASSSSTHVYRLRKALYGLKQAGRRWYERLVDIMTRHLGFSRCAVDQAVFKRRGVEGGDLIIVLVHVDDCTIVATSSQLIAEFKSAISNHVDITDLGDIHWLLGIEILRDRPARRLHLSQRSYIDSIIRRYGLQDLKPVSLPMDPNIRLTSVQSPTTTAQFAQMRDVTNSCTNDASIWVVTHLCCYITEGNCPRSWAGDG